MSKVGKIELIVFYLNEYKLMKNFFNSLMVLILISCGSHNSSAQSDECKICGNWIWEKNDNAHDFSLRVYQQDSLIVGRHCYVLNSGDKMDCALEASDFSFKIKLPVGDSVQVSIKSFYSGQTGVVRLKLVHDKFQWKLIKAPKGEYYLPKDAFLYRSK